MKAGLSAVPNCLANSIASSMTTEAGVSGKLLSSWMDMRSRLRSTKPAHRADGTGHQLGGKRAKVLGHSEVIKVVVELVDERGRRGLRLAARRLFALKGHVVTVQDLKRDFARLMAG
jgi:hypothetical protein